MQINKEDINKVAKLARLELTEQEVEKMSQQLGDILRYIAKLEEVDTTGVEVTTHPHNQVNSFRDDVVHDSLPRDKSLSASAQKNNETFIVPKVVG